MADRSASGGNSEPESSDSLKTFGSVVQTLREEAGYTRAEFGELVRYSEHMIVSIERGRRMADPVFVERATAALGGTRALVNAYTHVTRQPGLAKWFRRWAAMEESAINLYTYECRMIPGLLQTEAHARALFESSIPPLSDEEIALKLAARLERHQLLSERPNTEFSFIFDEHLLLRGTGGPDVNSEQIEALIAISHQRNVSVQIVPLSRGVHAGLDGPVQLLETPDNIWYAYCEGQESGQFITDPKIVSVLQQRYAKLRSQALTPEDTRDLLERMRGAQ
ncbi:helix-turn-helix domain-containing protein [Actinacidiphila yeochonensis]|uniref:helix-turn-helix domain-containing protein n=1 Tax=Actinacidiphila yeochonensis TaxID=89050 RepID=UPI000AF71E8D|nr:helix-turn-helix transcriptional regulator [Actinacidiphila yeochonensis]